MRALSLSIILLLLHIYSKGQTTNMNEQNKQIVRKVYEQALNKRKLDLLNDLVSDEYTGFSGKKGVAGFQEPIQMLLKAMPDAQWTIDELIAEDNKVMVKWKIEGTSQGPFLSFAASGKKAANDGMGIYTIENGKITAVHVLTDRLAFLQQLDVLPKDVSVLATKKGQVMFIDKFMVPAAAKNEFYERMRINRRFIEKLPGFVKDGAYEYTNEQGNLVCVTVAHWQSREALEKAREAVQAQYKKDGFDAPAMFKRLQISADRGIYTEVKD